MLKHRHSLLVALAAFAVAGCSHTITAPDGTKVTVDGDKVTSVESKDGKATISGDGSHMEVRDKDGNSTTLDTSKDGKETLKDDKGNSMEMNTAISEEDLGVPFYPGSSDKPGGMKINSGGKKTVTSVRGTSDDPAKVVAFYVGKLGKATSNLTTDKMCMGTWDGKDRKVIVTAEKADDGTTINVSVYPG